MLVEHQMSREGEEIAEAEEFVGFGGGDAGVGGKAVEVVEAGTGGPLGERGFAELGETFLETVERDAGEGIARGDGTTRAGIAAFEVDFAEGEADDAAFVFSEEAIFPEGGDAVDFESGAEAEANVVDGEARKPGGDSEKRCGGDDGGAVGDGVIGETAGRIADDDLLLEEDAEPFGGFLIVGWEGEGARGDFAAVGGDGEGDGSEIGGVGGADEMDDGSALAIDPFAIDGIESPGAIEGETARRGDAGFGDRDGIKRFDGMETDVGEFGSGGWHGEILAEEEKDCGVLGGIRWVRGHWG